MPLPLLVNLRPAAEDATEASAQLAIITTVDTAPVPPGSEAGTALQVLLFKANTIEPLRLSVAELLPMLGGTAWLSKPSTPQVADPDAPPSQTAFGFRWFVPELLKHRRVWRDVLLASLALQVITLATPLFTQAIIDKVVVHRTQSTLIAIGVAMALFIVFTSLLSWVRQYLVLHTGNRVDAVLGATVWGHLLGLPLRYFQHRPTGVVAARLHGVETIREFVASTAVTLVLDLPFLLICLGVMLWYSPLLSGVVVGVLALIALASAVVAPIFQARLAEQFQLGARNQAFLTEHIAGFETVKCLQMEPLLRQRYGGFLAAYLQSGFHTKQIGNTYNVAANTLEQLMTLGVLMLGAWEVMTEPSFTIGMLVAFQMFAGKLSQPVMRLVGLWAQFQQARLAVQRLGDVMNAPTEPHTLTPQRAGGGLAGTDQGRIEIQNLAFRYAPELPLLFEHFHLTIEPGQAIAIMGPSGSGKSTLAKLMLGFYPPSEGQIKLGGVDIRHLGANELRSAFGVVPQDTTLFSGSIFDNLRAANPGATLDQVAAACRMAGIHATIEALPQGYQTEIGERGVGLSGGQKQRLAIARALLKGPKVLIFDEATSALDAQTAEAFAATVNQLKGKVSMVFIAHGLPKALKVDRVVTIGAVPDGIVSEQGDR
ncbi:peptidase domain-containing ABC transporter [Ideonella azotifigens]|uniref:peptidase domain-containing ABC transporter n=1 Tax=Ideonella azotifigens TaxID=513160 RepID=UPI001E5C7BFC|nr:peptidase domain-containing ABC transporter [Ideonella azotifigens]MCD2340929.1 peptidase domain-containing ABC transporter [Ideonella azotifigens]